METLVITLNNAQIKALPTAPVTLVVAQDSGKRIVFDRASCVLNFTAGTYGNLSTDPAPSLTFEIAADGSGGVSGSLAFFGDMLSDGGAVYLGEAKPLAGVFTNNQVLGLTSYIDVADVDNQPLIVRAGNGGNGDFTEGNAANTLKITVYYLIEDI